MDKKLGAPNVKVPEMQKKQNSRWGRHQTTSKTNGKGLESKRQSPWVETMSKGGNAEMETPKSTLEEMQREVLPQD